MFNFEIKLHSESRDKLFEALSIAQGSFLQITPSGSSNYGTFATFEDIINATKDALKTNGLSVTFTALPSADKRFLMVKLGHKSGQFDGGIMELLTEKNTMQGQGSAVSYAMRYLYKTILGLAINDAEEDDGDSNEPVNDEVKLPSQQKSFVPKNPSKPISPAQLDWLNKLLKKAPKSKEDELVKKYGALINIPMGDFNAVKDGLMAKPVQQVTVFEQEGKPIEAVSDFEEVDDLPF